MTFYPTVLFSPMDYQNEENDMKIALNKAGSDVDEASKMITEVINESIENKADKDDVKTQIDQEQCREDPANTDTLKVDKDIIKQRMQMLENAVKKLNEGKAFINFAATASDKKEIDWLDKGGLFDYALSSVKKKGEKIRLFTSVSPI